MIYRPDEHERVIAHDIMKMRDAREGGLNYVLRKLRAEGDRSEYIVPFAYEDRGKIVKCFGSEDECEVFDGLYKRGTLYVKFSNGIPSIQGMSWLASHDSAFTRDHLCEAKKRYNRKPNFELETAVF